MSDAEKSANEDSKIEDKPQIEVASDESWKDQVKAEAARLDAEREAAKTDHANSEGDASGGETQTDQSVADQLPPANFSMLVQMFYTQAIVALGLIPGPDGNTTQELKLAQHFIDLLAVLDEKTKRNLTGHEAKLLENALHELRMGFLEVSKPSECASE